MINETNAGKFFEGGRRVDLKLKLFSRSKVLTTFIFRLGKFSDPLNWSLVESLPTGKSYENISWLANRKTDLGEGGKTPRTVYKR